MEVVVEIPDLYVETTVNMLCYPSLPQTTARPKQAEAAATYDNCCEVDVRRVLTLRENCGSTDIMDINLVPSSYITRAGREFSDALGDDLLPTLMYGAYRNIPNRVQG